MTESLLEKLLDKLETVRSGIIDVETEAQGIKVLVKQLITNAKSSTSEQICSQCCIKTRCVHSYNPKVKGCALIYE